MPEKYLMHSKKFMVKIPRGLIFPAILYLLIIFFWYLSNLPGVYSPDSLESIRQIKTNKFYDWHPVAYTLFVKIFSLNAKIVPMVPLVQSFLMAFTVFFTASRIIRNLKTKELLYISSIIYATPFVGNMANIIWKDIPFTCLMLIGFIVIWESFDNLESKYISKQVLIGIFILGIASLFRKEAMLNIAIFFALMWLIKSYQLRKLAIKKLLGQILSSFLILISLNQFFGLLLNVYAKPDPTPSEFKYLTLILDLAYTKQYDARGLPKNVGFEIDKMVEGKSAIGARYCNNISKMYPEEGFNYAYVRSNKDKIPQLWIETLGSKAGTTLLYAHYCQSTSFIPFPFATPPSFWVWGYLGVDQNSLGIESTNRFNWLKMQMHEYMRIWNGMSRYVAWPGIHLTLILLTSVFAFRKKYINQAIFWMCIAIAMSRSFTLIVIAAGPSYRYGLIIHLISLILLFGIIYQLFSTRKPEISFQNKKKTNKKRR